jgi:hypothetical protein
MEFQIPYKLLFTHFMFATLALRSIKCEEVNAYLPIYTANYLGILSDSLQIPRKDYLEIPIYVAVLAQLYHRL